MKQLSFQALRKAEDLRISLGYSSFEILDIFEICSIMNIVVRYTNIDMEGFFVKGKSMNSIILSNRRPLARRIFTCAHELGHYLFQHSSQMGTELVTKSYSATQVLEEKLVDKFAAALLMPPTRIQKEINQRKWEYEDFTPLNCLVLASLFGVGYSTILVNLHVNKNINTGQFKELNKSSPRKIFKSIFPEIDLLAHVKIFDFNSILNTIEIEVENYLITLNPLTNYCGYLRLIGLSNGRYLYKSTESGIFETKLNGNVVTIKIAKKKFEGIVCYRFNQTKENAEKYRN